MALLCATAAADEPPRRYSARFIDGTVVVGEEVRDWHDANATPRIAGHALFDQGNPAVWIVAESPPEPKATDVPEAGPYVEFVGGDRFPGEVLGFDAGADAAYRRLPPHFLVRPTVDFRRPNAPDRGPVRIESERVRRIVFRPTPGEPVAARTALFRDGRRVAFRAARWGDGTLSLLTETGVQAAAFSELAEVCLDGGDPWQAYLDAAAAVLPDGEGRLIQIETADGLVALTSNERLRAETHGDGRRPDHWHQIIQPAWCLDPLWVRFASVRTWRFFPPERVPLPLLEPNVSRTGVVFSAAYPPQVNLSALGGPLGVEGQLAGWGFGVFAPCEMSLPLPAAAVAFRSGYGLDPTSAKGGCVRAAVVLRKPTTDGTAADAGKALFTSDLLIGTAPGRDTGRLELPADPAGRELVLVSDPVFENRPSGADPFDVRDALSWLSPDLELDPQAVRSEIRRRALGRLPGLAGWTPAPNSADRAAVKVIWDVRDWEAHRFRSVASVEAGAAVLSRTLRLGKRDRFLAVAAHCPLGEFAQARLQVRIDGEVVGEFPVPNEHGRNEPNPTLVPIERFAGKTVVAEIVQLPGPINEAKPAAVDWRGAGPVEQRPSLVPLFEDDPAFAGLLHGDGTATLDAEDKHSGERSLKVTPPGASAAAIPGWDHLVTSEPEVGEFRFVRFSWKAEGKGPVGVSLAHDGLFGVEPGGVEPPRRIRRRPLPKDDRGSRTGYRYVAGPAKDDDPEFSPSLKLDGNAPAEWRTIERDLFNDFGVFTLTGLRLAVREGTLKLDGAYLARSQDQFRFIEEDVKGLPTRKLDDATEKAVAADWRQYPPLTAAVAPGFGVSNNAGELTLLKEYRGRPDVLRTRPEGGEERQSVRLTAALDLTGKKNPRVLLGVSQFAHNENDQKDWELVAFVDGQQVFSRKIDAEATGKGWLDVTIDLAPFAGRAVRLELRNKPNGNDYEWGYWHNVRLESD